MILSTTKILLSSQLSVNTLVFIRKIKIIEAVNTDRLNKSEGGFCIIAINSIIFQLHQEKFKRDYTLYLPKGILWFTFICVIIYQKPHDTLPSGDIPNESDGRLDYFDRWNGKIL